MDILQLGSKQKKRGMSHVALFFSPIAKCLYEQIFF